MMNISIQHLNPIEIQERDLEIRESVQSFQRDMKKLKGKGFRLEFVML